MTRSYRSPTEVADAIVASVGKRIVLGLPVGLGKAIHVANALFQKAREDSSIQLTIFTALTLEIPEAGSDLEKRFLEPLTDRLFSGWPKIDYAVALRAGSLRDNIKIRAFYFRPASFLGSALAQQGYTSLNYSQVPNELLDMGVNVIAQLVSRRTESPGCLSLSSNPEVTIDLLPELNRRRRSGQPIAVVGQVNQNLPYMTGVAELEESRFDILLDNPELEYPLFGIPNRKVSVTDYATGMHVASLIPDGGTLQVGIGSLSDAVAHCLRLRHQHPDIFRALLERLPGGLGSSRRPDLTLALEPFEQGLYVSTELLSDAVFSLYDAGIVKRTADEGSRICMHAGFFIGSNDLYAALRGLSEEKRSQIAMTSISFVNTLYGDEMTKRHQRRAGRFVNEAMMVSLLGGAVSDGLEDGRVVSGVGGQFDFVRMGHDLKDAHSILMIASQRMTDGVPTSNIRWNYGHVTVPRHYRDIFVSEYGLAATRGRPDSEVIGALLAIADSAFQDQLLRQAKAAGKIHGAFRIPDSARGNHREIIEETFTDPKIAGYFPDFPMGTDLTDVEQQLALALTRLKQSMGHSKLATLLSSVLHVVPENHWKALDRLALSRPRNVRERLYRKLVSLMLAT